MAKIVVTTTNRRIIKMSSDDVMSVISQYQSLMKGIKTYEQIRNILKQNAFYLPEDL